MKNYALKFSVTLIEGTGDEYSPAKPLSFDVKEKLPVNVDAQKYIRARLAEELKRNFDAMHAPIDNKTDEAKEADDPLTDGVPF